MGGLQPRAGVTIRRRANRAAANEAATDGAAEVAHDANRYVPHRDAQSPTDEEQGLVYAFICYFGFLLLLFWLVWAIFEVNAPRLS
ncbi:hypothetical protein M3Y99_01492700 [Aphelenchoides fujianensis]|nr:hypothetical protein M3Y99_01492700 [Aphelenchoides fujianensis]